MILRYHPTQCLLPEWADRRVMTEGIRRLSLEPPSVRLITPVFDLKRIAVEASPIFPRFGKVLEAEDVMVRVEEECPVDGTEIVSWMQDAPAAEIVASARQVEYNKHSLWDYKGGDPAAPGIRMGSLRFNSEPGYRVRRIGGMLVSPEGSRRMPMNSSRDIITRDFLGWAAIGPAYGYQWFGFLSQVKRLANKIETPTGFMSYRGMKAPQYALAEPPEEQTMSTTEITLNLNRPQRMVLNLRNPENFTEVVDTSIIDLPAGECGVSLTLASYPAVPPLVYQMTPPSGVVNYTVLDRFEVV